MKTPVQTPSSRAAAARRRWRVLAPTGLAAVGLGASLLGEATLKKGRGEAWFAAGTVALVVLNSGLCLFGEAVKQSVTMDAPPRTGG